MKWFCVTKRKGIATRQTLAPKHRQQRLFLSTRCHIKNYSYSVLQNSTMGLLSWKSRRNQAPQKIFVIYIFTKTKLSKILFSLIRKNKSIKLHMFIKNTTYQFTYATREQACAFTTGHHKNNRSDLEKSFTERKNTWPLLAGQASHIKRACERTVALNGYGHNICELTFCFFYFLSSFQPL